MDINDIMTFAEACESWGLGASTLRTRILNGAFKDLSEGIDYRKSGKVWLITKSAMIKLYGEPKNKDLE